MVELEPVNNITTRKNQKDENGKDRSRQWKFLMRQLQRIVLGESRNTP